ncbi:MAG TPA: VWA domain-containing protein [Thermoguttaceae bacterium]|nr:VWA domain-containing protein [Thermoguttaceae bacterium]
MFNYDLSIGSPGYLALLALVPCLWWFSFRQLALLGRIRRAVVITLRSILLGLLILALADVQVMRTSDRLTVIYLLDQSWSIPEGQRQAMLRYVNRAIRQHRQGDDRVGVIVFGREADIEVPPFDDDVQIPKVETQVDGRHTNLAAAVKLAQAAFPEDSAKRIVVVSDGNENLGNVVEQARAAADAGIGIDVVPIRYQVPGEVAVERLVLPGNIRPGQPFYLKAVLSNSAEPAGGRSGEPANGRSGEVRGKLVFSRLHGGKRVDLNTRPEDQLVVLPPGVSVFTWQEWLYEPAFYTYEVRFTPDEPPAGEVVDVISQNNLTTAFTHVRGKGRVLLITDRENRGEFDVLIDRLGKQDLEVVEQHTDELFNSLADLQLFDTVVLANVPRVSGEGDEVIHFTDAQIKMLLRNTQQMGGGLVMLGGPQGFGAGGWGGTELEQAMPVDFHIQNVKVVPKGALVMMMHACEIPEGNYWQKVVAREAIKMLGPQDYCGLIHWNGDNQWILGRGLVPVQGNRDRLLAQVDRIDPGDMPDFDPALKMALQGFADERVADAKTKHMIVISDGDPEGPSSSLVAALVKEQITVSTVSIGDHSAPHRQKLQDLATDTGGKFHRPLGPQALPRIFQREARRVTRPLIWEKHEVQPQIESGHELVDDLGPVPPIKGFVLTTVKTNPLVDVHLVAPEAAGRENSTILASWTYGLGKVVAFTSDAGDRWTGNWEDKPIYDKLFGQIVRWSMRPSGGSGKYTVASEVEDGRVRVVVTALDENDEFLNLVAMSGAAVDPDLMSVPVEVQQTGPGRYEGTFPARDSGSYFVTIHTKSPDGQSDTIRTGVTVPYSDEFRDRQADDVLLGRLAEMVPKLDEEEGEAGEVIRAEEDSPSIEPLLAIDTFRHAGLPKAISSQDVWFYLVFLAGCLLFFDVFFRRVQVSFAWVPPLAGRLRDRILRRELQPVKDATLERLRSRKAEVAGRIEQLRSDARFEPPEETAGGVEILDESAVGPKRKPPTLTEEKKEIEEEKEESYTERLLRAKKKLWGDK